jgi:small conductance mechanosensitive channel
MDSLTEAIGRGLAALTRLEGPLVTVLARLLAIIVALALAFFAYRAIEGLVDRLLRAFPGSPDYPAKIQRAQTLGPLMKSVARYLLAFVALLVILRQVGIDIQAILVSAGVAGLAIGLGAQSLIKDVITGFFLLFEGLVSVGDVIEVGPHAGAVEAIGLRVTKIRLLNGAQRIIPNGELTQFANYNRGWARAVVDVSVAYEEDVGRALRILEDVGRRWAEESRASLEPPQAQGILRFGEDEVGLRLQVKVHAQRRWDAELELRRRIKEAFAAGGVRAPRKVIHVAHDGPAGGGT